MIYKKRIHSLCLPISMLDILRVVHNTKIIFSLVCIFFFDNYNQVERIDLQGVYENTGHSNIFTYLTFDFKTSAIVQQNDIFL